MFYPDLVQCANKIKFIYMTCLINWINCRVQTADGVQLVTNGAQFSKSDEIRNKVCLMKLQTILKRA